MTLMNILPIITYILLIVLLIVLIILGIKVILIVDKADKLVDDIQQKVSSFNSIFKLIDFTSEKLTSGVSSIIETIIGIVNKLFRKRKEEKEYE